MTIQDILAELRNIKEQATNHEDISKASVLEAITDRVIVRTHYPWGGKPGGYDDMESANSGDQKKGAYRIISSRDAAVARVPLSKDLLMPYAGLASGDNRGWCNIEAQTSTYGEVTDDADTTYVGTSHLKV